ncbi:hypothetical protein [Rahnella ecdela]|uniref:ImpA domain-containing protein n=1 Tax=Rahnella ecdela TaxID=2816250 RepID=A0ABS6LG03_9GAMM|nr:hypothetical protein [Rahnella ecdela]MBU9845861.1 hypothetical protein [Rahnella ecdela]
MKNELGVNAPKDELREPATAAGYLGDYLRGNVPINQLLPQHEYIVDTLKLGEEFEKNTKHMMLLTLDEADKILNELLILVDPITTYAGNIKDSFDGTSHIRKLVSYYNNVDKLIFNFRGLGIKAQQYVSEGINYIKITGYAGVRRILRGTRYSIDNPQVLELSIGKVGRSAAIMAGARFCIYFSAAYRVFELVFKDEYSAIDFIGDINMDVAKILVTIYTTELVFAIASGVALVTGITLPLSLGIFLIVFVGFGISYGLLFLDEKYQFSDKLKFFIQQRINDRNAVESWNLNNSSPFINSNRFGV